MNRSSRSGSSKGSPHAIASRLRAQGLRVTAQRVAILQVLARSTGHPTVDEIYRGVRRLLPMISLNTVYKTLNALRERGELIGVGGGGDGAIRFESNPTPHHHAVCLGCRKIQDVMDPGLDALERSPRLMGGFAVVGHRVELFGYCRGCRGESGRSPAKLPEGRPAPRRRGRRAHR